MNKISETVVFFGSGPVAAKSLEKLVDSFNIEAVITKPKPEHHKYPFPVIESATRLGLKLYTPIDKKELDGLFSSHEFNSRVGIVIDYGIIISEKVINNFPLGIINSHFSLLPKFRGADPISFAVLSGENKTGVSLMRIVPALDEGPLLAQEAINLDGETTTPILTDRLIDLSDYMLKKYIPSYLSGELSATPQPSEGITYTRKLTKDDSKLDFHKPASQLAREIRAFLEWPRSRTEIAGHKVIITQAHVGFGQGAPGAIWQDGKQLGFYTLEDVLIIDKLIPEGKKEMDAKAFLAGYNL